MHREPSESTLSPPRPDRFVHHTASDSTLNTNEKQPPRYDDPAEEDLTLPTRTLSREADLDEYRKETATGTLAKPGRAGYKLVTFTVDDPANPKNWSKAKKWWCTLMIALVCFTVAFCSAVITADIAGVNETFHVSEEVSLLTVTLFVVGFGIGALWVCVVPCGC